MIVDLEDGREFSRKRAHREQNLPNIENFVAAHGGRGHSSAELTGARPHLQNVLGFALAELFRQLRVNGLGILTERFADPEEFHHIQPPFAVLNPPDERLFALQRIGQLLLGKSGGFTHVDQLFENKAVLVGMGGLLHLTA